MKKFYFLIITILMSSTVLGQIKNKTLDTVQVNGIKPNESNSSTFININKKDLKLLSNGQDFSEIISLKTPSVTTYSDGSNNYGYTYFRIRGLDQTRINMSWNGIPLNDAEDQGFYASNFVNFNQYISNINVERGVGTSKNGVASVGGTINFESYLSNDSISNIQYNNTIANYNTFLTYLDYNSGILKNGFNYRLAASYLHSDGYRNNSGTIGESLYFSSSYKLNENNLIKLNLISGNVDDKMAFLAASEDNLNLNRKFNDLKPDETDNFKQTLVQFQLFNKLSENLNLNSSIYYNNLDGHYYQHLDTYDNFKLYSQSVGFYNNILLNINKFNFTLGTNGSLYYRTHSMDIVNIQNNVYENTGYRNEVTIFGKINYNLNKFNFFLDGQYRYTQFVYKDVNYNKIQNWFFFNPKGGINYNINEKNNVILTISKITREPTRSDLLGGADLISKDNVNDVFDNNFNYRVKPENLTDYELGYIFKNKKLTFNINGYYMDFNNEIIAIGPLSYIGLPLRRNVRKSFRIGIENEIKYIITSKFDVYYAASFNKSRIKEFTDESTNITYYNSSHLLNPTVNMNAGLNYKFNNNILLDLNYRYVSSSYLDNTSEPNFKLNSFNVVNTFFNINLNKNIATKLGINNILNNKFYYSGYDDGINRYYYPASPTNFYFSLTFNL